MIVILKAQVGRPMEVAGESIIIINEENEYRIYAKDGNGYSPTRFAHEIAEKLFSWFLSQGSYSYGNHNGLFYVFPNTVHGAVLQNKEKEKFILMEMDKTLILYSKKRTDWVTFTGLEEFAETVKELEFTDENVFM